MNLAKTTASGAPQQAVSGLTDNLRGLTDNLRGLGDVGEEFAL